MSLAIGAITAVAYFAVGGWAVYRVHRLLPWPLLRLRNQFSTSVFNLSMRLFVLVISFLVATTPVYLLGYLIGAVL